MDQIAYLGSDILQVAEHAWSAQGVVVHFRVINVYDQSSLV